MPPRPARVWAARHTRFVRGAMGGLEESRLRDQVNQLEPGGSLAILNLRAPHPCTRHFGKRRTWAVLMRDRRLRFLKCRSETPVQPGKTQGGPTIPRESLMVGTCRSHRGHPPGLAGAQGTTRLNKTGLIHPCSPDLPSSSPSPTPKWLNAAYRAGGYGPMLVQAAGRGGETGSGRLGASPRP